MVILKPFEKGGLRHPGITHFSHLKNRRFTPNINYQFEPRDHHQEIYGIFDTAQWLPGCRSIGQKEFSFSV